MSDVIVIERLTKSFRGTTDVLRDLSWRVPRGTVVGLLGRNGSGKSTLLQSMLGLLEPDGGRVRVLGEDPFAFSDAARARIGYVPQDTELFGWLTPRQMLEYFAAMYPRWNEAKVQALLERWSVEADRPIERLSPGTQQRLSIIRALGHEPELLVLDEPVSKLDPAARRDFLRELVGLGAETEVTVVFSTHILSDLERVAGEVALLRGGRIAVQRPLDVLIDSARRVSGPPEALPAGRFRCELARSETTVGRVEVLALLDADEADALRADPRLRGEAVSLEDFFVEVA